MRNAFLLFAALWLGPGLSLLTAEPPKLPDGPGKATTEKVCSQCHGVEVAISRRESKDGWNAIIDDMVQRGAKASDDEFGEVVDYLSANFSPSSPVNVNDATVKLLKTVLDISGEQAAAIVKYRETNGKFKSIADLAKVPGIDAAKLEAKKSKLAF
jgi:competence protein ComEA